MSDTSFLFHLDLADCKSASQSLMGNNADFLAELQSLLPSLFVSRNNRQYGYFDPEVQPEWLACLHQGTAEAYDKMAEALANQWLSLAKEYGLDGEGQLFIHIAQMDTNAWLYITWSRYQSYWVRDDDGRLNRRQVLQPEQLDIGLKCHLNDWQKQTNQRYLSLLSGKAPAQLKKAFIALLGFKAAASTASETAGFLNAVESFARQQAPEQQAETRTKVVDYCQQQEKQGEDVTIAQLAELISQEDPQKFQRFAIEHDVNPDHSWLPDRQQLRQFARFSGRDDHLSISFSASIFGQAIHYDKSADALVIKNLPKRLRGQIQKHLARQQAD